VARKVQPGNRTVCTAQNHKGQACVALNTFGVYKKTFLKQPVVGTTAPAVRHVAAQSVAIPVFGHSVELPLSFAEKPFKAELIDLSGRTIAVTKVDSKQAQKGTLTLARIAHSGMYMVKCTGESGVVVRKFMVTLTK